MTDRYAVIGNPIRHSKSPQIHGAFAAATGEDIAYTVMECAPDAFAPTLHAFRDGGGRGVNVTAPFKVEAFELSERRSERAALARAANTLRFDGSEVAADNFDGVGLVRDIQANIGFAIAGRRVLVLGAGGAARGILPALVDEQPAEVLVVTRSAERAAEVASVVRGRAAVRSGDYGSIRGDVYDVVLNATSASLSGHLPPVDASAFATGALAYDLAYGVGLSPFLALARDAGAARVVDGVGMLVEQAAEAFAWWRGIRPETRAIIETLAVPLG